VLVYDARKAKAVSEYRAPGDPAQGSGQTFEDAAIGAVVLTPTGTIAWTTIFTGTPRKSQVEMLGLGADKSTVLDAASETIDPESLALIAHGKRVYWSSGDATKSAPLP
jgi:hypothetical protein